jgi:hypothetical protein
MVFEKAAAMLLNAHPEANSVCSVAIWQCLLRLAKQLTGS